MKKNQILKGYDDYIEGKKRGATAMYLITGFSLIIVIAVLSYSFLLNSKSLDLVKVIDESGRFVPTETKREQDVLKSSIQAHLDNTIYLANSFERADLKENNAKTYFLMDTRSANRIFNSYKNKGAYNDALENGVIYKTQLKKITSLEGKKEPFLIEIEGETTIYNGSNITTNKIVGKGKIGFRKPSYPSNPHGLWLYDYTQEYENLNNG